MCCLFGIVDHRRSLTVKQKNRLLSALAIAAEARGTDATGIAYNSGGKLRIYKRPWPARRMRFRVPVDAEVIMGHTRMATQGSARKRQNNHPFLGEAGGRQFALAHNGVLYNDKQLRYVKGLPFTAVFLPFSVFSSIILAHERYIFNKLVGMLSSIASPILNLVLLFCGFGSVGLVVSATILNFVTYGIYTVYAIKKLQIRPSFQKAESGLLQEILRFSFFVFLASIVDILYWSTDKLIIGWAVGSVATAVYNIGASFNGYVTSLSTAISGLLVPRLTEMVVKDAPREQFTEIFIKIGRLQFIIISFIVSAFVAFGRQFIAIWAGPGYEDSYYVALLTMIPVTIPLIQNTGLNILYALNKHKFRSIVYACIAVVNVVLTFWWVESYGIIGAAMATCLAYVLGNILIINWYYYKKISLDIPLFWKNIVKMSPVMLIMGTVWWFILDRIQMNNWLLFFALAVVYTMMYLPLAYRFMMNQYEREIVIVPVKKVLRKFHLME